MAFLNGLLAVIDRVLWPICCLIVVVFASLLALQVGMRYLLDMSFFWIEELCRFLLIYLTFLGSTLAWGRRNHISIDFLSTLLGSRMRVVLKAGVDLVVLGFSLWAFFASLQFALGAISKISISMGIPMGLGYMGVPMGFLLISVQCAIFLILAIVDGGNEGRTAPPGTNV